jgi:putative ABC transport system substrate-binding protein
MPRMRRREFIALLGGAAAWPLAARAQQGERMRRIGVLNPIPADHQEAPARTAAFQQGLQQLGWTVGLNVRIDYRWSGGDAGNIRKHAWELVALAPDVILASGVAALGPLLEATRTVPIVFPLAADPVGAGFVESLARPGGNVTGFATSDYRFSGKWLELLKEIAPGVTRAAVIRDPSISAGMGMFGAIQSMAPSLGVEVSPINVRDAGEMERAIGAFARSSKGGLIVTPSGLATTHRDLIVTLAARHKLPTTRGISWLPAAWAPMVLMRSTSTGARPVTWIASSRARSRPTCRCRSPLSSSLQSISRPRRRLASKSRRRCSPARTR